MSRQNLYTYNPKPKCRFSVKVDVDSSSLHAAAITLRHLADKLDFGTTDLCTWRKESYGEVRVIEDKDQTEEKYFEQLREWKDTRNQDTLWYTPPTQSQQDYDQDNTIP